MRRQSILVLAVALSCFIGLHHAKAQARTMSRKQIIAEAEKMALAHFKHMKYDYRHRNWTRGTLFSGATHLSKVSDNAKLDDAIKKFVLSPGFRNVGIGVLRRHDKKDPHHADDFCVSQAYLDYSVEHNDTRAMADTKRRLEPVVAYILSTEAANKAARFSELGTHEGLTWSWIDALFMAAPLHARLTKVTGDPKYLKSMLVEWKRVSDRLYDKEERLYYRDKVFLTRRSKYKKKIFWARGNGWVMGAFAHTLPYIPKNHPQRRWLVEQFKEMSAKLASIQRPDGTWSPSLVDYKHFPYSEMSGTAFYCFAMAWGINNKILDAKTFRPVVVKAWAAMLASRTPEGILGYVQGVGAEPSWVQANGVADYGTGAFLMAAAELSKMAPIKLPPAPKLSAAAARRRR